MKDIIKKQKGFTIIEVLIVLAIAGLIILIVFLAVPALQRNSRNTQRKNDVSSLLGATSEFMANKNGQLPASFSAAGEFIATGGTAGSGVTPKLSIYQSADVEITAGNAAITTGTPPVPPNASRVYMRTGAKCNAAANDVGGTGATSRNIAVVYTIETSGGTTAVCQES